MPIKRRTHKARILDEDKLEDLFYGPGTCLFNGSGYLGSHGNGFWRDKSPETRERVLAEMREDWLHWQPQVLEHWAARDEHQRTIAAKYHGAPTEPWAQTEFGGQQ